eukprot:scaffold11416_cov119-Isochrysis_galbana.AAC.8
MSTGAAANVPRGPRLGRAAKDPRGSACWRGAQWVGGAALRDERRAYLCRWPPAHTVLPPPGCLPRDPAHIPLTPRAPSPANPPAGSAASRHSPVGPRRTAAPSGAPRPTCHPQTEPGPAASREEAHRTP